MKPLAILLCFLFVGCSYTPDWSEYKGPSVTKGTGGTLHQVDGMDVWDSGTPPRQFKILGTMYSQGGRHSDIDFETEQIVKAAREKGADAIVLISADSEPTGEAGGVYGSTYPGGGFGGGFSSHFLYSPQVRAMLIKYL